MSVARLVGVNLLVLLAGVIVLELCFGSWIADNRIRNLNLVSNRLYVHDVSPLYDNGGEVVVYERDAYALRGEYSSPAEIDILTMGGSTTDQKYLSEGQTWQDVLRADFARDGRDVSVVNAGVDGHSTRGHIRSFEWWLPTIPGLAPKYVLFLLGVNDIHLDTQESYDRLERPAHDASLADTLRERSALVYALRTLRGILRARETQVGHRRVDFEAVQWVDAPVRDHHAERSAARRQAYAQRLRRLARETRAIGAEPIFVTQLMRSWKLVDGHIVGTSGGADPEANGVDMYTIMSLFNRDTLRVCRSVKAICFDLASALQPQLVDADFYDFIHTTPSGARKIGDALYAALKDELEL